MTEQMITLREFREPEQAEAYRDLLELAGLHPVVVDNRPERVSGYLPVISRDGCIQLQVPEDEAAEANALLRDSEEQREALG